MTEAAFDPGEVWDALNDDEAHNAMAARVNALADQLVALCGDAVHEMAQVALDESDCGFAEEVSEHEAAFVAKLARTALHVALCKRAADKESA